MTMIAGGAGPRRRRLGHCGKPLEVQCQGGSPGEGCACSLDLVHEIVNNGGPIDYGPHYSPPPTPSPGTSAIDDPGGPQ